MKTFAVVRKMESPREYWDGHTYDFSPLNDGRLVRSMGQAADGEHYAVFITCGSAIRDTADNAAKEIGGRVVEVESEYWPGHRDILNAISRSNRK